jgi:hypothetical protein
VGEAKEVEAGSIRCRMACVACHQWTKVDDACLVRMERKPKSSKTLAEHRQNALCVDKIVERHNRVISEADKGASPPEARRNLAFEPLVKHMVQEDVRQAGRDHAPLRGALSRAAQVTVFDGSCVQPFIDHPSDDAVRDSLVKERSELGMRNRIEVFADIDLHHPV